MNALHVAAYERALIARKRSRRTIDSYSKSIGLLTAFHGLDDVTEATKDQIEAFMADQLGRLKATSAGVRFRDLRAFFNWAVAEEIIARSPMVRMMEPKPVDKPIPVVTDEKLKLLLKACAGTDFAARRDTAIIRMWCEPGSPRVSEMADVLVDEMDMRAGMVRVHGKGDKIRDIPFGAKTGQALDRYLRVRAKHKLARAPRLWLGDRHCPAITASGLAQMLRRRCDEAGIERIHPHQLRHTAASNWADSGGSDGDAMVLFGWSSAEMPRRYGRAAKVERAHRSSRRLSPADRL